MQALETENQGLLPSKGLQRLTELGNYRRQELVYRGFLRYCENDNRYFIFHFYLTDLFVACRKLEGYASCTERSVELKSFSSS